MSPEEFSQLCTLVLSKEATAEEVTLFERLIKQKEYKKAYRKLEKVWQEVPKPTNNASQLGSITARVAQGIRAKESDFSFDNKASNRIVTWRSGLSMVAAAVLVCTAILWAYYNYKTPNNTSLTWIKKETKVGQKLNVYLSDGTKVILSGGSKLRYPKTFAKTRREIFLEGEAFIEVTKDLKKPFLVKTPQSLTQVLGTKFNVRDLPNDTTAQVALIEGSVEVHARNTNAKEAIAQLKPNQMWVYHTKVKRQKVVTFEPEAVVGWKDNNFKFDDLSFAQVKPILERHLGVHFVLESAAIGQCKLTGNFKDANFSSIIMGIAYTLDVAYEQKGNTIYLRGEGCAH